MLSILVLEDIAMAAYLPLIGVLLVGGGVLAGTLGAVLAIAVVVGIILLAHRAEAIAERVINHEDDEQVLLRVLGLTLLVAGVAESLGISSAVGAFLVGLAIPNTAARRARRVLEPLRDLLQRSFSPSHRRPTWVGFRVCCRRRCSWVWSPPLRKSSQAGTPRADSMAPRGRMRAGTALVAEVSSAS